MLDVKSKLPKWVELCKDLRDGTSHFLVVHYFGRPFYIPVTKDVSRALGIHMDGKVRDKPYKERGIFDKEQHIDCALRDIISALYLQTRDNVLAEIEDSVKDDIHKRIDKLLSEPLRKELDARATEAEKRPLLPEGNPQGLHEGQPGSKGDGT